MMNILFPFEDGNIKTNNEKNEKVKKNDKYSFTLSSENIGADPTMPINNIIATYFAPRFEWDAGGGDPSVTTIEHYNNDFFIYI